MKDLFEKVAAYLQTVPLSTEEILSDVDAARMVKEFHNDPEALNKMRKNIIGNGMMNVADIIEQPNREKALLKLDSREQTLLQSTAPERAARRKLALAAIEYIRKEL